MRNVLLTSVLTLLFVPAVCEAAQYTLSGTMDALQAGTNGDFGTFDMGVPGAGDGTGTIAGTYDDATNLLNYALTWENLTSDVSNMHFHVGAPGVGGGVDLAVPAPWASPQIGDNVELSEGAEANLLGGDWYLNVHTVNFGGGEIRGQVLATVIPEPSTLSLIGVSLAAVAVMRRCKRTYTC